ncbi:tetratricopeptide repeat protein (plasmid) [Deinococcus sp. KNUC1210]|uniref:tetratricopeptide repeat protein n=1 Tax=Deinococcus sp. KNUC1210 TaxID=2917691 RepID=UPI001EF14B80|nr:tetratricopeptide repeat protein [Deinococcus sp. KNUC1210]ULH18104.1 tetratricopeptide repeat protein [Deinococcus sp. KNUC1210]
MRTAFGGFKNQMNVSLQQAFDNGNYTSVLEALASAAAIRVLTLEEQVMHGIALLRSGDFIAAQPVLEQAAIHGSQEAAVEYANALRASGRPERAAHHLSALLPQLQGELRYRALRWLGSCQEFLGVPDGWKLVEEARLGYLALGHTEMVARLNTTLAALYCFRGRLKEADQLLKWALPILENHPNKAPFLTALSTLADLQLEMRCYHEARETVQNGLALAREVRSQYNERRLYMISGLVDYFLGETGKFVKIMISSIQHAEQAYDILVLETAVGLLADHYSRMGDHAEAVRVLMRLYHQQQAQMSSLSVRVVEAMMARRRGDLAGSYQTLMALKLQAEQQNRPDQAMRAGLQAMYSLYKMRHFERLNDELSNLLMEFSRLGIIDGPFALRLDFPEIADLLVYINECTPDIPWLAEVLSQLSDALGADIALLAPATTVHLRTFGQLWIVAGGVPADTSKPNYRNIVLLLAYLSQHSHASAHQIQQDLFSEMSHEMGMRYVFHTVADLLESLGPLLERGGDYQMPTYTLSHKVTLTSDFQQFFERIEMRDREGAQELYHGQFLEGIHGSRWVDEMRRQLAAHLAAVPKRALDEWAIH